MKEAIYVAGIILAYWLGTVAGYRLARLKMLNAVRRWMHAEIKKPEVSMSSYQAFNIVMEMLRANK